MHVLLVTCCTALPKTINARCQQTQPVCSLQPPGGASQANPAVISGIYIYIYIYGTWPVTSRLRPANNSLIHFKCTSMQQLLQHSARHPAVQVKLFTLVLTACRQLLSPLVSRASRRLAALI